MRFGRTAPVRRVLALAAIAAATAACSPGIGGDAAEPATPTSRPGTTAPDTATPTSTADAGSSTTTPSAADDDPLGGFQPDPLAWAECGDLDCATLQVPLDWEDVDGDTLELAVARRPASGESTGSVLVNPGGPGASGIDTLDWVFADGPFDALTDRFDVVGWDPRGTNDSQAVMCDDSVDEFRALDPSPDDEAELAELNDTAEQIADDCERVAANLLAHISTDSTVKDMEAIRRALGDEQLSFYGFSYGTALGSFYADEFPDRVRAIVLDGVIDPDADLEEFLTAQTQGFEDSLDDMFDSCGSSCPDGGADALYDKLAAEVEREPIGAGSRTLGPAELATAAISATYSPGGGPGLARALSEADDGNTAALLTLARQYYDGADFTPYLAIECVDQAHPENETEWAEFVERLEEISPRLGASIGYELLPCATWPVEPVDPRPFPTATGSKPILVVGNTGDAATPFLQAEKMAARLDNAVLLTHEGTGHTSYGNACVDEITAAYLVDLTLPDNDTICRG